MIDTFIMRGEWLDNIETLPLEMQDKVLAEIVRYGTKKPTQYDNDPIIFSLVNAYKGRIDSTAQDYAKKVEMSKTAGRKKKLDENKVWALAKEGRTAQQIADELEVSKSSIDKSEGWKQRKNEEFVF